jgi:hypothetical protein
MHKRSPVFGWRTRRSLDILFAPPVALGPRRDSGIRRLERGSVGWDVVSQMLHRISVCSAAHGKKAIISSSRETTSCIFTPRTPISLSITLKKACVELTRFGELV